MKESALAFQRAAPTIGPDVNPFRAIWDQWEAQGGPPHDKGTILKAETALKQALAELGQTNVPEFARSRNPERYTSAVRRSINCMERQGR